MSFIKFRAGKEVREISRTLRTYPCGSKCLDETVKVDEGTGLDVMQIMQVIV